MSQHQRVWLSVVGAVCAGGMILGIGHTGETSVANDGDPKAGRATQPRMVVIMRKQVPLGQPIELTTRIENMTAEPVTIWNCGYWPNHLVILQDREGLEPPLTEVGKSRKRSFFDPSRDKNFPTEVGPGTTGDESSRLLTELYDLKPGRYSLKVLYSDGYEDSPLTKGKSSLLTVLSGKVEFEVTPIKFDR